MLTHRRAALVAWALALTLVAAPQLVDSRLAPASDGAGGNATAAAADAGGGRFIVQYSSAEGRSAALAAASARHYDFPELSAVAVTLPTAAAVEALARAPGVALVEEDARKFPMVQTTPYGIPMVQATAAAGWTTAEFDAVKDATNGKKICIIDSGYSRAHPDLSADATLVTGTNNAGTGNWYEDTCGHGTHVAGTISALSNTVGVVGVNPNGVKLHIVKVFNNKDCGWTYSSTLVNALSVCRNAGANVVSMSLGGGGSSTEQTAFANAYSAGVLSIAAAGNAGTSAISYPAGYASVVSVAAVDSNKAVASFSQFNSDVELAAPGVNTDSTYVYGADVTVGGTPYQANEIDGSPSKSASGALVDGGLCGAAGAGWTGKVVLCERGTYSFATKVAAVESGGGVAAIIFNNVDGNFFGTLNGATSNIPSASIARADGLYLRTNQLGAAASVTTGYMMTYAALSGTSMATPHASGVAALVWSQVPACTNADVRLALQQSALDLGNPGKDNYYGYGLVQSRAALDKIKTYACAGGVAPTPAPPPPSVAPTCTGSQGSCTATSECCAGLTCSGKPGKKVCK